MEDRRGKRIHRIVAGLATIGITAGLVLSAAPAMAYTHTGCHWITGNLGIRNTLSPGTSRDALNQAIATWSNVSDVNLVSTQNNEPFRTESYNYGATGWEGQASYSCVPGFMTSVLAKLNSYYTNNYPTARKKVIWLHELGHGLGLGHVTVSTRVMYTSASTAYLNGTRNPTSDDINGVNALY